MLSSRALRVCQVPCPGKTQLLARKESLVHLSPPEALETTSQVSYWQQNRVGVTAGTAPVLVYSESLLKQRQANTLCLW